MKVHSKDGDIPFGGPYEPAEHMKGGRLARPVLAKQGDALGSFDDKVEILERPPRAVHLAHAAHADNRRLRTNPSLNIGFLKIPCHSSMNGDPRKDAAAKEAIPTQDLS